MGQFQVFDFLEVLFLHFFDFLAFLTEISPTLHSVEWKNSKDDDRNSEMERESFHRNGLISTSRKSKGLSKSMKYKEMKEGAY